MVTINELGQAEAHAPEVLVWNIIFLKADRRRHYLDLFTGKDWRHVVAYGWSNDRWIVYDVGDVRSQILVLNDYQFDSWHETIDHRVTAAVKFETTDRTVPATRVGLWCVTAVKHLTGLRSGALRPKALFRHLLRNGGEVHSWYGESRR